MSHADESSTRVDELLALAALGELTAEDEQELDELIAADDAVASELSADRETVASIQRALAEAPPPELRAAVLDAIGDVVQQHPDRAGDDRLGDDTLGDDTLGDVRAGTADVPADVVPISSRRRRWMAPLAAAAAVIAMVAGAVAVTSSRDGAPSEQAADIAEVVDAADAVGRSLDGSLGDLEVVYSASAGALALAGTGVEPVGDDETYQLWLVDGAEARSVGVFRPGDDGTVAARFDDVDPTGLVVGVTREPAGGSASPTLPILATT
jgi:anti-sigma-K factor RskA